MKILTSEEINTHLGAEFFRAWDNGDWSRLSYCFRTGGDCGRLNTLAKAMAQSFNASTRCILIIEETGVFPSSENLFLADALRLLIGERRPISEAPAYLFDTDDVQLCRATIQICLINFWDFVLISDSRQICFRGTHDEYAELFGLDINSFARVKADIETLGFSQLKLETPD